MQATEWEKAFMMHIFEKGLLFIIHKEHLQFNNIEVMVPKIGKSI